MMAMLKIINNLVDVLIPDVQAICNYYELKK
jgi:hypothetical protein